MKSILFINHFTQTPDELGNSRFPYLLELLSNEDVEVEQITTSFSHRTKKQRNIERELIKNLNYKLTTLYEPGYKKNISLKRFYSHYILGKQLKKYLKTIKKPEIIYCSIPSIDVAYQAAVYAKKNDIKFILDIQDLWPEAFKMIIDIPVISDIVFFPMRRKADFIYKSADEIISVSNTYLERALYFNTNSIKGKSVYLGTDLNEFDKHKKVDSSCNKGKNELWLVYIGTLGHSYEINKVIDAVDHLHRDNEMPNIKIIIMGDGPLRDKFINYSKNKNVDILFTGRLDYSEMIGMLSCCDIAVNPIKKNSAGSIINKVGDYAAAGLPVINTQDNQEYRDLLKNYNAGYNCDNSYKEISNYIKILALDPLKRKRMGLNNRKLAEDLFNREITYKIIIDTILER